VLFRIDPQNGNIISKIRLGTEGPHAHAVVVAEGAVWVAGAQFEFDRSSLHPERPTIWKIDPSTEWVITTMMLVGPEWFSLSALVAGERSLWATCDNSGVFRIDTTTLEAVWVASPKTRIGGLPRGLAFDEGSVWVTDDGDRNAVLRIEV
jgi:hypothetical protein